MLRCPPQADSQPPQIVVTGVGLVSALGTGWQAHEQAFREERTGFGPISRFDVSERTARTAALVDLPEERLFHTLSARAENRVDHGTRMLLLALREAMGQAGLKSAEPVQAMIIGTSAAAMEHGESYSRALLTSPRRIRGQTTRVEHYQPQTQMRTLAGELGWPRQVMLVSNACASGANAVGMGLELLRSGRAQCVITGGYDAVTELVFAGFDALRALAPSGLPRPFDAERDGLALGEGAGVLILETSAHAHARGATPIARLGGYHTATDLHHLTQPDPAGTAAVRTMTRACEMAEVTPAEIDYINSHGTGTPFNDAAESAAIATWAGDALSCVPVSSTKSAMGHLLGGAGAVEAGICVMSLAGQWLPGSLNIRTPDTIAGFDLVRNFRPARVRNALTNSFGFGGTNASLVFRSV
ncbi:MAG: beta-ketoacyl-[acyl-carrier-protein] synthase family protein [Prosthecobacter sp.]